MTSHKLKFALALLTLTLIIIMSLVLFWLFQLDQTVQRRLEGKKFASPVAFYSSPKKVFKGQKVPFNSLISTFKRMKYRARKPNDALAPGDYVVWYADECRLVLQHNFVEDTERCIGFKKLKPLENDVDSKPETLFVIAYGSLDIVYEVFAGNPPEPATVIELEPELFAQYYGEKPIIRTVVDLGDVPAICLNALLSIEDSQFLEHKGVSPSGIFRALIKNIKSGRFAQGGSTITQQLVKNYFLTPERTLKRKVKEMGMAFVLENRATKDEILETYLNVIYMGQLGSFEIRGYQAASEYYFGEKLENLELHQCALLAAIVNSPGLYNPFKNPERAARRKSKVLTQMITNNIIDIKEAQRAEAKPLPKAPFVTLKKPAHYFVESVRKEISNLGLDIESGLKVFTTLNVEAQTAAQNAVTKHLERLESWYKSLKEKADSGKHLEAALVAADPTTGFVEALVGGRNFRKSQFNRATQSRRQIGSIVKPLVYLSAFDQVDESGRDYNPFTLIPDEPFEVKYDGQTWSPKNYTGKFHGSVPMYYALQNSLNSATAQLGLRVGLGTVVENAHALGIQTELATLPSLTLGAVELSPFEVLQVYSTLARQGEYSKLTVLRRVEDLDGHVLYQHTPDREQVVEKKSAAKVLGMMEQVIYGGTGRGVRKRGFLHPAAGKTGTTSDTRDAWFGGFTPLQAAVAWVGYDDNSSHGLTGASGALPIWTEYMKSFASQFPPIEFDWPEGTEVRAIDVETQIALGVPSDDEKNPIKPIRLVFDSDDDSNFFTGEDLEDQ